MKCKIMPVDDLDRIAVQMRRCTALLYALADSELAEGHNATVDALFGLGELLEIAYEGLRDGVDVAKDYPEGEQLGTEQADAFAQVGHAAECTEICFGRAKGKMPAAVEKE